MWIKDLRLCCRDMKTPDILQVKPHDMFQVPQVKEKCDTWRNVFASVTERQMRVLILRLVNIGHQSL